MKSIEPLPKRLIICCDGTWQSSVSGKRNIPSNITRLARTIAKAGQDANGKQWQQLVYYDSGVGTGSLAWIEQARQGGTGDGLVVNVLEAYNFLVNNYAPGDQIFCFGFSRGAFTARAIAGLVTDVGIFKPSNMQAFAPLWALYKRNLSKQDFRKSKQYFEFMNGVRPMVPKGKEHEIYHRKPWEVAHRSEISTVDPLTWPGSNVVEVVGVFDTVGSLGLADTRIASHASSRKEFEYLNVKLSPFINHAFHALALDDHREPFLPTLWYIPNKKTLDAEEAVIDKEDDDWPELKAHRDAVDKQIREHQATHPPDLYQVWFPGVHINIGGGSDEDSADAEGLSNVTFAWMVQQLGPYLAFEPWTWSEITVYQQRVQVEEKLYRAMKAGMTREEEKQYGNLIEKSTVEKLEDKAAEWGHWIWQGGKRTLGLSKEVKMVPVPAENIRDPEGGFTDMEGKPVIVRWAISEIQDSYTAMYRAMSNPVDRTPGQCTDRSREDGKKQLLTSLGATNEYIHPAVWWRYTSMKNANGDMKYRSRALEGFRRQQDPKYGSWGYYKEKDKVWIPEWFMKTTNYYLEKAKLDKFADAKGDEPWQHAEWTYTDNVSDSDDMQPALAGFYVDAQNAKKAMEADKKVFPFGVTM